MRALSIFFDAKTAIVVSSIKKMSAGIVGLTILVLIKSCVSFDVYSNACEDYSDYVIRYWSRRCYYNPDVLSNTVSTPNTNKNIFFNQVFGLAYDDHQEWVSSGKFYYHDAGWVYSEFI